MNLRLHRREMLKASMIGAAVMAVGGASRVAAQDATPDGATGYGFVEGPGEEEITVTHAQGETVVRLKPETVISYDITSMDTLAALDVQIAGMPELSSGTEYLLTEGTETVGSLFEPDYEKVNAMQPDLIIIAGRSAETFPDLSGIGPTIDLTFQGGDILASLDANTRILAKIFGKEAEAERMLEDIHARVEDLQAMAEDVGTGMVIMTSGGSVTALSPGNARAGRGALIYDTLGIQPPLEDLETATHGEPISFEFLLEHDPDWLFVVDRDQATGAEDAQPAEQVLDNDIMHETTAWQEEQIVYLNPFDWYIIAGAGLNSAQRMLDELEAAFGS